MHKDDVVILVVAGVLAVFVLVFTYLLVEVSLRSQAMCLEALKVNPTIQCWRN